MVGKNVLPGSWSVKSSLNAHSVVEPFSQTWNLYRPVPAAGSSSITMSARSVDVKK
jgi:hypothetical protein